MTGLGGNVGNESSVFASVHKSTQNEKKTKI